MKKKRFERAEIEIDNLLLDLRNPRAKVADSQRDEIQKIIADSKGNELVALGRSLIENDQNPLANIGVVKDGDSGKYITLEGNRRLTALKLLNNPSLSNDDRIEKAFSRLASKYEHDDIPSSLFCVVFKTREDAVEWIQLTHTGENDGVGVKRWSTNQQNRFKRNELGVPLSKSDLVVEYLQGNSYFFWEDGVDALYDIHNITTLERIFGFKGVFDILRLHVAKDGTLFSDDDEFSASMLHAIFSDVDSNRIKARSVFTAELGLSYVKGLAERFGGATSSDSIHSSSASEDAEPDSHEVGAIPHESNEEELEPIGGRPGLVGETEEGRDGLKPSRRTPSSPNLDTRKKIIVSTKYNDINVFSPKASQIKNELKKISCVEFPISSALLIRCFFEMTAKECIKACRIDVDRNKKSHLGELFYACKQMIIGSGTEEQKDNANKFRIYEKSKRHVIDQLEDLNAIIHDTDVNRDKTFFFTTWDTFRPFIQDLWNLVDAQEKKKKKN